MHLDRHVTLKESDEEKWGPWKLSVRSFWYGIVTKIEKNVLLKLYIVSLYII